MPAFDAIIAGGGPGGMLTALLARQSGARVVVSELRAAQPTRWNVVYLTERSLELLDRVGAKDRVLVGLHQPDASRTMVPLDRLDGVLRRLAAERGIPVHYSSTLDGIRELAGPALRRGVGAAVTGSDGVHHAIRGSVLVDATGGRLGIEKSLGLGRVARTQTQRALVAEWPRSRAHGNQFEVFVRGGYMLGSNDAATGARGTIIGYDADPDLARIARRVARKLRVPRQPVVAREITLGTSMAEHARAGSIVGIGDTVSTVHPQSAEGVNAALADASLAARMIDDIRRHPSQREQVLTGFEQRVLRTHRRAVARSIARTGDAAPPLPAAQAGGARMSQGAPAQATAGGTTSTPVAAGGVQAPGESRFVRFLHRITGLD